MGVFQLIPDTIYSKIDGSSSAWEYADTGVPAVLTNANMRTAIGICGDLKYLQTAAGDGQTVAMNINPGTNFLLDGVSTDRNNTPPGFLITDFSIQLGMRAGTSVNSIITLKQGPFLNRTLPPTIVAGAAEGCVGSGGIRTYTILSPSALENFSLLNDPFGVEIANIPGAVRFFYIDYLIVTGNYIIESWTVDIGVTPTQVSPGTTVTITDEDDTGRLTEIDDCSFFVEYRDLAGVLQTVTLPCDYAVRAAGGNSITLFLGTYIPYGGRPIRLGATVTSVEYTGTVTLASLNPLLVDGSGIYKIVKNKREDTYFDRTNPLAPVELDVKIPNPFIKTGYF
jgi:hypothetical protein